MYLCTYDRPQLSQRRAALCSRAFAALEQRNKSRTTTNNTSNNTTSTNTNSGVVSPAVVAQAYAAEQHPAALAGRCTAQEALAELLECLEVSTREGVTRQDFFEFCACVSAAARSDEAFAATVKQCWRLSDSATASAASASGSSATGGSGSGGVQQHSGEELVLLRRHIVVTHSDGRQDVLEVLLPADVAADDTEALKRAAAAAGATDVRFVYPTNRPPEDSDLLLQQPPLPQSPHSATAAARSGPG
jgi:hypothetical protein